MQNKNERIELRIDNKLLELIDTWRREQSDLPARSEAIRRLIYMALPSDSSAAIFQLVRFNVLSAGLTEGTSQKISDAYLYAWDESVYPIFHDDKLASTVATHFRVGKELMQSLIKFLDSEWLNKKVYSFYDLEDRFGSRYDNTEWDRGSLIIALRYAYLSQKFDTSFWQKLIGPTKHPLEASSITREFIRTQDIYFQ